MGENHSLATRMVPPRFLSKKALEMNHCSAPKKAIGINAICLIINMRPRLEKKAKNLSFLTNLGRIADARQRIVLILMTFLGGRGRGVFGHKESPPAIFLYSGVRRFPLYNSFYIHGPLSTVPSTAETTT